MHHPWPAAPDVIWHIYSHLYCSLRDGGRDLPSSGEAAPTMGQVPCEFWADWPTFIFQPVASDMIWHIYSHLYCSLRDGGRDLSSSGQAAPTMGQVPCEFQADWPNFIFEPVAPDVIWYIYSHLYYSLRDGCRDLLSWREVSPTMRKVPCEFWADRHGCSFSGEELRQGSLQPCPAQDYASSMAGGSRRHLTHLLTPVLLLEGWWQGLAIFRGGSPYHGPVPCEFWADQPNFIFQPVALDVIWHIYSHLYCSSTNHGRDLSFSGEVAPTMGKVPCEFQADQTGCSFSVEEFRQGSFQPCPARAFASSMASGSGHDLAHLLTPVLLLAGWW